VDPDLLDPDLLNSDPDTALDPAFPVNPDRCDGFFLRLMSTHLVILWRVIHSSPLRT
jgi:hypothetical protein